MWNAETNGKHAYLGETLHNPLLLTKTGFGAKDHLHPPLQDCGLQFELQVNIEGEQEEEDQGCINYKGGVTTP